MTNCTVSWSWCYQRYKKGAQVRRMCQESPAHAGPEEKAMGTSGHHNAIPWEDYLFSGAGGSDSSQLRSPFSQVKRRGERSRSGWHEIRGTVISVVVGVRVICTLDFINYLHTQLFHNHPSLVMFDRKTTRQTGNVAGIKATGGNLLLQKESRKNVNKKERNQSVADLSWKLHRKKKWSYLGVAVRVAASQNSVFGAISEALVECNDDRLQHLDPTCPHTFWNFGAEIFVPRKFCQLLSGTN